MATVDKPTAIPAEDLAALERAVQNMIQGIRDPALMDQAARDLVEGREEIRQRLGELDIAVDLTDPDEDE